MYLMLRLQTVSLENGQQRPYQSFLKQALAAVVKELKREAAALKAAEANP